MYVCQQYFHQLTIPEIFPKLYEANYLNFKFQIPYINLPINLDH